MRLAAQPIDAASFARYGRLVPRPVRPGRMPLDDLVTTPLASAPLGAGLTTLDPEPGPFVASEMERHPFAVQLFLPVEVSRYLVAVATGASAPDPATLRAFLVPGDIGVAYGTGVWHLPMRVLDRRGTFLVLMHRVPPPRHEDWHRLDEPLEIEPPAG